jgi:porphobilinogen synthase
MVAETALSPRELVLPFFVIEGENKKEPIQSLPGVYRLSMDLIKAEVIKAAQFGIGAIVLFPVVAPHLKTSGAEEAFNENNLVCRTVRYLKNHAHNVGIICDIALDPYTSHGHDGLLRGEYVANDETIEILCLQALSLAKAGCDVVAPSDMMDGRIRAIRNTLDKNNFTEVSILAYAAKYASSFYGPFRGAVGSSSNLGQADKFNYQMDPRNSDEALREIGMDIDEGADLVMIKPALPYLDIIARAKQEFHIPILAYQVSGEYAMIKAAAQCGTLTFESILLESLISIKRAGAKAILTYGAMEVAEILWKNQNR